MSTSLVIRLLGSFWQVVPFYYTSLEDKGIANILNNSDYLELRKNRYVSFDYDQGAKFSKGEIDLEQLSNLAATKSEPDQTSGKQELFESLINKYI